MILNIQFNYIITVSKKFGNSSMDHLKFHNHK